MFALGLVCWLFDRDLELVNNFLREKFAKKPAIAEANIKVIQAGWDYGHNTHSSAVNVYRIESKEKQPGRYMDITGNKATAYGFIAAAEKAGLKLYLGSYPITPATDVLHELSKHKSCGVITVQCEDEISGCASALGASFAGALGVTSTSGPGICLKSEAMNLAVIMELPLVVLDVQRAVLPRVCPRSQSRPTCYRLSSAVTVRVPCPSWLPPVLPTASMLPIRLVR